MIPASLLEAEKTKHERRSQKVLGILTRKDERIAELEARLESGADRREAGRLRAQADKLKIKIKDQAEQIEVLVSELSALRQGYGKVQAKDREIQALQHGQKRELEFLRVELDKCRADKAQLERAGKEQAEQWSQQRSALEKETARLGANLATSQHSCEELQTKVLALEDLLATAKRTTLEGEGQLARARDKIKRLTELRDAEDTDDTRVRQLELQVRTMASELEEKDRLYRQASTRYESLRAQAQKQQLQSRHHAATALSSSLGSDSVTAADVAASRRRPDHGALWEEEGDEDDNDDEEERRAR